VETLGGTQDKYSPLIISFVSMKTIAKKLTTVHILILYFLKQFKWARTIFTPPKCLTGKLHSGINISGRANAESN
jgi:hypothetical protein